MSGKFIELIETENSLIIRGRNDFHRAIRIAREIGLTDEQVLWELLDDIITNSMWDFLQPEDIGALTSAPILGSDVGHSSKGYVNEGNTYWFPNYQIQSAIDTLLEKGEVIFQKAEAAE